MQLQQQPACLASARCITACARHVLSCKVWHGAYESALSVLQMSATVWWHVSRTQEELEARVAQRYLHRIQAVEDALKGLEESRDEVLGQLQQAQRQLQDARDELSWRREAERAELPPLPW